MCKTRYSPEAHAEERWEFSVDADGARCFPGALAARPDVPTRLAGAYIRPEGSLGRRYADKTAI